jgi:hypothetical protein
LRLIVSWDGQRIVAAEVVSTRPQAARILLGQAAERAQELVPRLFSLCGHAQGVAARLALLAARDEQPTAEALSAAGRLVALEAIGEHLWRLLLDWPPMLACAARQDEFVGWRKRLQAVGDQAAAAALGGDLLAWLDQESPPPAGLSSSLAPGALLPWRGAAAWAQEAIEETFARRPSFAGQPAETGALARRAADAGVAALRVAGDGVAARLAARYADLRFLAGALVEPQLLAGWLDAAPVAERVGLARVETARGLLLHLIQVNDGRVGRYVIVAPTEWNFHPQGVFAREITGCPAASRAQAEFAARRLALALDPCIAYEVVVNDA